MYLQQDEHYVDHNTKHDGGIKPPLCAQSVRW